MSGPTSGTPQIGSGGLSLSRWGQGAGSPLADLTLHTHLPHTARLEQLGFNALLQLMIGVPLEMVHGLLRISLLYLAGVLAGEAGACALATSLVGLTLTALPLLTQAP